MIPVKILMDDGSLLTLMGKPVIGAEFRNRQFVLCAKSCVDGGLLSVLYMVVETRSGLLSGFGMTKAEALAESRAALRSITTLQQEQVFAMQEGRLAGHLMEMARRKAAKEAELAAPGPRKTFSKTQRRAVFKKSDGKCHYCEETLLMDSAWHVEHMTPWSLGGSNEIENLVAACAPCNVKKGTKSAAEFKPAILALAKQMGVKG